MNALRFSPRRFLSLLKKEAIEIFRDRSILFMGLALPLLMLLNGSHPIRKNEMNMCGIRCVPIHLHWEPIIRCLPV